MNTEPFFNNITVIIKSFLRNKKTQGCFESFQKQFPGIKFIIIDDGYFDEEQEKFYDMVRSAGHTVVRTEFDIGLAAGRNMGVKLAHTPYVLMVDNDHFAIPETNLQAMYDILEARPDISIAGGKILEKIPHDTYPSWEGFLHILVDKDKNRYIYCEKLEHEDAFYDKVGDARFTIVDITHNFFLMRRSVFPHLHWDEVFKICGDHMDFFLDVKARQYKVAFVPDSVVWHYYQDSDAPPEYDKMRNRYDFLKNLGPKWNVKYSINFFKHRHEF